MAEQSEASKLMKFEVEALIPKLDLLQPLLITLMVTL